jgi:hypothetical protein
MLGFTWRCKFPAFLLLIRSWVLIYCSGFGINPAVVVLDVE